MCTSWRIRPAPAGRAPADPARHGARVPRGAARPFYLELDSQPQRLDLNDVHCRMAREHGVLVSVVSDAHDTGQFDLLRYGVTQARRGWLGADDVLNTRSCRSCANCCAQPEESERDDIRPRILRLVRDDPHPSRFPAVTAPCAAAAGAASSARQSRGVLSAIRALNNATARINRNSADARTGRRGSGGRGLRRRSSSSLRYAVEGPGQTLRRAQIAPAARRNRQHAQVLLLIRQDIAREVHTGQAAV